MWAERSTECNSTLSMKRFPGVESNYIWRKNKTLNSPIRQNALRSNIFEGSHALSESRDTCICLSQIFFSYIKFILKRPSAHSHTIQLTTKVLVHIWIQRGEITKQLRDFCMQILQGVICTDVVLLLMHYHMYNKYLNVK